MSTRLRKVMDVKHANHIYNCSSIFNEGDGEMIAVCLFWALGTVVSKDAFSDEAGGFRVFTFTALRFWIASATLFTMLYLCNKPIRIARRDVPRIAAASFFGLFLFMIVFNTGLALKPASYAGMLMALIPLLITATTCASLRRPLSPQLIIGLFLGGTGVLAVSVEGMIPIIDRGMVLILISAAAWSIYAVCGEIFTRAYPPLTTTAWTFLFCAIYFTPLLVLDFPRQNWLSITHVNWRNLLVASFISLAGANTLYYLAIKRIGSVRSGIYIYLEPIFTVMLAMVMLNERIGFIQYFGFTLIVAGVMVSKLPSKTQNHQKHK